MDKRIYFILIVILTLSILAYSNLYLFLSVLLLLGCFIPLLIYLRYGRDLKIKYKAEYEQDIPTMILLQL
jgi:Ca2+/Na+ antiporter